MFEFVEKLTGQKLEVPEVSQSEEGQRHKLQIVLGASNQVLGLPMWSQQKWSVESVHSKSLVAILYLLVHLARHFRAPLRLPENVNVETVVVKVRIIAVKETVCPPKLLEYLNKLSSTNSCSVSSIR